MADCIAFPLHSAPLFMINVLKLYSLINKNSFPNLKPISEVVIMSNLFEPTYPLESIGALCHNLFAFEYVLENIGNHDNQEDYHLPYTSVYFHVGTFNMINEQQEIMTFPFHLTITQDYVLLIDSETEDVVTDFQLTQDVFMIIDHKQAFFLKLGEKMASIRFNREEIFERLREIVPSKRLLPLDTYLKEAAQ